MSSPTCRPGAGSRTLAHLGHLTLHEALELITDPQLNTLVQGPHPTRPRTWIVFHYREVCDPVQSETYQIDGITVSNFLLPHYYNSMGESGGRNDFLGNGLPAFRWNENGVIGFWDPPRGPKGKYVTWPEYDRATWSPSHRRMKRVDRPPLSIRPSEGPWKYLDR